MNICDMLSATREGGAACRCEPTDTPPSPKPPDIASALLVLSDTRRQAASYANVQAQRQANSALIELQRAETALARSRARATALERLWHSSALQRESCGLDIVSARAVQAQREASIVSEAERVRVQAQLSEQAQRHLSQARQTCLETDRRHQKLQRWRQRFESADPS